jgi:Mn-dependent DtxR family transcriptional regulator
VTESAWQEASQIVRNRRLWDLYLHQNTDVSPAGIDRNQSLLDHALDPAVVAQLEEALGSGKSPAPPGR